MPEKLHTANSEQPQKKKLSKAVVLAIVSAIILGIAAVVVLLLVNSAAEKRAEAEAVEEFRTTQLATEADRCIIQDEHFDILDDGDAIQFSRATKYDGADPKAIFCFLNKVGAPETLEGKIGQTRALDGTRTDSWDGFEATWTYHPDSGLSLLVERTASPVLPEGWTSAQS